jgi:hypothetical protein
MRPAGTPGGGTLFGRDHPGGRLSPSVRTGVGILPLLPPSTSRRATCAPAARLHRCAVERTLGEIGSGGAGGLEG